METIKIKGTSVNVDFSNTFVVARVQGKCWNDEDFMMLTADIAADVARRFDVNGVDVELIAISEDNKAILFSANGLHRRSLYRFFPKSKICGFFMFFHDARSAQILERMKEVCKDTRNFKCFCEVTIDPSVGSYISDVVKEMKYLSEILGLPVCAKFNNKNLRITPTTDLDHTIRCFWKGINTESIFD